MGTWEKGIRDGGCGEGHTGKKKKETCNLAHRVVKFLQQKKRLILGQVHYGVLLLWVVS